MPGTMFEPVVSPQTGGRSWLTVGVAFVLHTGLLVVLIVVPLVATDVLPIPQQALQFVATITPVMPSMPPPLPRPSSTPPAFAPLPDAAPLVALEGINPETAVAIDQSAVPMTGAEGLISGFGGGSPIIDAPPPVQPTQAPTIRVGGAIKPPVRIKDVSPEYPAIARLNHIDGVVIIQATIGVNGKVEDATVLRSRPMLDEAALNAVRQWEYTPTLLNGVPTRVIMTVTVVFTLK